jgi:hypothetical protein
LQSAISRARLTAAGISSLLIEALLMVSAPFSLREDYWDSFELQSEDTEFLYNYLLEQETPLTPKDLLASLVGERIRREKANIEKQRSASGDIYLPKGAYQIDQRLVFPTLGWANGSVTAIRPGHNPELGEFQVIQVAFAQGEPREFAAGLVRHALNDAPVQIQEDDGLDPAEVIEDYGEDLLAALEEGLEMSPEFVRIAGRWFPRALLVDINAGHLNLVEAVLDMNSGGPMTTADLLKEIGLESAENPRLLEFSIDRALQEDPRFDEVGPAGRVLWFLHRLEPAEVLEPPALLRYAGIEYDRSLLTKDMLNLERELDDELSPIQARFNQLEEAEVHLIYPHLRSGTLPLSAKVRHLFPTAYEAPRIRFTLVDGATGESFPAWVLREKRYVFGLKDWYRKHGLIPGSIVHVRKSKKPGEVIIHVDARRSSKEWLKTVLVGSDGGLVYAMLRHTVSAAFDDRMAIAIPDEAAVDQAWERNPRDVRQFEKNVAVSVRELAKLNPQSHVHASELYAAINVIRRCPPGPILTTLASHPQFVHVGDLHFRYAPEES